MEDFWSNFDSTMNNISSDMNHLGEDMTGDRNGVREVENLSEGMTAGILMPQAELDNPFVKNGYWWEEGPF